MPRNDQYEKAIKFISHGIKNYTEPESLERWSESAKTEVGYDKSAKSFGQVIKKRLDRVEDLQGLTLMEKVRLIFIFSRPVNPEFVEEAQETAEIQFKTPHNVQAQSPPASPQSLPDPPEIDEVEMGNEEEQENQESEAPGMKEEINRGTSTNENSILNAEEGVDVTTESIQQEAPFNGTIDYDEFDIDEYPEFMVPNEIEPPMQHNKRHPDLNHENPKRHKIDEPKESEIANPPEINDVEMRNGEEKAAQEVEQNSEDSNEPSSGVDNESNNQNQVASVGDKSIDDKHAQNLVQITQKRVKIEDILDEIQRTPEEWIPDEKTEMPPPTISLLKLAEQIETLAYINFDQKFQQKALRAVHMFKARDKSIPIQDFNQLFNVFLTSLKRERTQNSDENSMQLSRIFKHLQRTLIRPLGEDLMAETLGILDAEIEKLGEIEEHV
ncbi:hypothetical protein B9Z55_027817 [Caenorhabditis nigoni]|uniref:SPK domain-containing protein n=1 Tax=Caenorhabditis nigoni TaxID=1611254 RepID=A0A2G5SF04_9PELO|nr:hypothetical protein B9Z55_027817 [Caenorhabditis nigoni]